MRIVTLNANGIRSAAAKGLFAWLSRQQADVVCLQEIRAQDDTLADKTFHPRGVHALYQPAERKGYAGVGLLARRAPDAVIRGFGVPEFDREGRYLEARFANLSVVSVYLPSGSAGPLRQASKRRFMEAFAPHLAGLAASGRDVVLCGDWNIAHKAIDLENWRSNQDHSGFLPEERAWMDRVFGEWGLVDVFRRLDPRPRQYTWWSNRGAAWANNVGWRIDYQVATPGLAARATAASIYKAKRFSDHAPLVLDYAGDLA